MGLLSSGIDWTARTYDEVCARHQWSIPARLNIGVAACDCHAGAGRLALTCVDEGGRATSHTFDELKDRSDRAATALAALGVGPGARVAVLLPQGLWTAVAHLAAFKLGAITVPLSPLFREDALSYRLGHSRAKVIVTDDEHSAYIAPRPDLTVLLEGDLSKRADRAAPLRAAADTSRDDPAMLIYTSGTSGMPKGALHAHRFLPGRLSGFELIHRLEPPGPCAQAEPRPGLLQRTAGSGAPPGFARWGEGARAPSLGSDRPFWTPADWAWVGGLVDCVLTPWVLGCPVLAWRRRGFDPEAVLAFIAERRVRSLFLPPTAIHKLRVIDDPRARFALDVATVHTAGEPLSPEAHAWATRAFGEVYELYGLTEMGATIGCSPYCPVKPGSMGRPYPGHTVELLAEGERPAAVGEIGEIAVKRGDPGMFLGYFEDPAGTEARFRGEWLVTGDLARRDEDGYFHYQGRADDVFNTSGYRVGPTEIEATLQSHPAVAHAAVVGEPDAERGAVVKAFVVLRPGFAPDEALAEAIRAHVGARLAAYERPRRIVFARELPVTVTGKVRRAALREAGADARYGI